MIEQKLINELNLLLPNNVFTSPDVLKKHGNNLFYIADYFPDVVCFAESDNDVIKVTNFCIKNKIPLIPYGSGTSVEGHTAAINGGICLNLSRMDKILKVNIQDEYVIVQAGISYNKLNEFLEPQGFNFPVEAGWGASIGGMLSTNASGAGAVDAGSMAKNVMACEVVTYKEDSAVKIHLGTLSKKSSAGYNVLSLFIGAEGTLGVVTEVCLKIRKNFPCHKTICCQFESIQQAIKFIIAIKDEVQFRRAELLDELQTKACVAYSNISSLYPNKNTVIIELGGNEAVLEEEIKIIKKILNQNDVEYVKIYGDKKSAEPIWAMRKNACLAAIQFINKNKKAMATDTCVPLSKLNEFIQECYEYMNKLGLKKAPLVAHIGDGNVHFTLLINPEDPIEIARAKEFNRCIVQEALKVGGTCTGEHGIGIGKKDYLHEEHGDSLFLMEAIKLSLDPLKIFNPGKIFNLTSAKNCYVSEQYITPCSSEEKRDCSFRPVT